MKNNIKPAIISLLTSSQVTTIADSIFHNGIPIFMLHRISQSVAENKHWIYSNHLHNCLDYLVKRNYEFVSLNNLIGALVNNQKLPVKSVVFTMDDGYIDQAEIAAPIFLEYDCPVTFFVITGMLDQRLWPWDSKVAWIIESSTMQSLESSATIKKFNLKCSEFSNKRILRKSIQEAIKRLDVKFIPEILQNLAHDADIIIPTKPPSEYQPMTWDMARNLENQGIQFAPHSASHNILSKLDQNSMKKEIVDSWNRIKSELNNPLHIFCYPNGTAIDFSSREIVFLKDSGFIGATSTIPSIVKYKLNSDSYIYSLPRLPLPNNMPEFIQYCSWVERARAVFT